MVSSDKEIQSALILAVNNPAYGLELTTEEYEALKGLDDSQLAQLSMQLSLVYAPENFKQISGLQITTNHFIDCLLRATGIQDIRDIIGTLQGIATGGGGSAYCVWAGTNILINAKTAFKLFQGVAVRYLGWIGLGFAISDFADCIKN